MPISSIKLMPEFDLPETINRVVCCDLDETYIPFSKERKVLGGVHELESYLENHAKTHGVLLGWITGTNLQSALRKADGYVARSPHFICCSLGTEFYWVRDGRLIEPDAWKSRIAQSGFQQASVNRVLAAIQEHGITLEKQADDYQGPYKASFYYPIRPEMEADFSWIEQLCAQWRIRVLISRCNPAAGDPADCYDMDFIPISCGKDQAVLFLREEMRLPRSAMLAFGDSCNDFPMFAQAGRAYLVANADQTAISRHGSRLEKPYCHGILSVLTGSGS